MTSTTTYQAVNAFSNNVSRTATTKDLYFVSNSLYGEILSIEAIIKFTGTTGYKEFSYDGDGNITEQLIYSDTAGTRLSFTITYGYTGDDLTLITTERESDGFTYTKTFTYDIDSNLESITIEEI